MASLIRRSVYTSVPGWEQPDPIVGPTENLSMPFAGTGGSATSGIGVNPIFQDEAPSQFFVTSPLVNYSQFRQEYDQDTSAFGMLASFFGPNVRRAQATPLRDLYPESAFTNFGYGGTNVGVNVVIDWDLANKQAETGSVAWYRKIGDDMRPPMSAAEGKAIYEHNEYMSSLETRSNSKNGIITTVTPRDDWNKPNQNLFGGFGVKTFASNERLAPTSISRGSGLFSGPVISMHNPSAMRDNLGSLHVGWQKPELNFDMPRLSNWSAPISTGYKSALTLKYWG